MKNLLFSLMALTALGSIATANGMDFLNDPNTEEAQTEEVTTIQNPEFSPLPKDETYQESTVEENQEATCDFQ